MRWIYRRLCNPFRTLLTQEMLCEMLRANSKTLKWTVSLDFGGGVRDVLTMTVTCDKVESNAPDQARLQPSPEAGGSQCTFRQQLDGSYLTDCGLSVSRYIDTAMTCPKCRRKPFVIANSQHDAGGRSGANDD